MDRVPIRAAVNGVWRVVGSLSSGNPPIFVQRIKPGDILKIAGAAGIDLQYDPPLPPTTIIRHEVVGQGVYEIPLEALLSHPMAKQGRYGPKHPQRVYLPYNFWHRVDVREPQQVPLF